MMFALNFGAIPLFFLFGWLFTFTARWLRADFAALETYPQVGILQLLVSFLLVLVLHELIHGFFFTVFTGERAKLGFRGFYAYAAAPDWYIPRQPYTIIGLAPLILISLTGLLVVRLLPLEAISLLLFALTVNAAGSIGDLYITLRLAFAPRTRLVQDTGDAFTFFGET
jgi:hypothetical protein